MLMNISPCFCAQRNSKPVSQFVSQPASQPGNQPRIPDQHKKKNKSEIIRKMFFLIQLWSEKYTHIHLTGEERN